MLSFYCISFNDPANAAIGEAQLAVEVTSPAAGSVYFEFHNFGPIDSSITDIYWEAESLEALTGLVDADDGIGGDVGVDFSPGADPTNLPSANDASPPFVATTGLMTDSDSSPIANGVGPGQWLGVYFSLQAGKSFDDVLGELGTGTMRIGMHVQSIGEGGSESFINEVPEPATMTMLALGSLVLLHRGRRYAD
jgi:hypothetical protein